MNHKTLTQGERAKIMNTGQVVEIKRVSDHGFSVVKFQTGGDYIILNDRLESFGELEVAKEIRH